MDKILLFDSTLRDGNHAVSHQLSEAQIKAYATAADAAGVPVVIVGHGNGIGASSLQVGESAISDYDMLQAARKSLKHSMLGVYDLPGFSTIKRDLKPALDAGVDVVCVGCHCSEADVTKRHIEFVRGKSKDAYANLMMVHMIPTKKLVEECLKLESYGALGIILMDSAGAFLPHDVTERISALKNTLKIPFGFHAHDNLGMGVMNSVAAVEAGATILDCCARGFGAGAGNAQIELIVAVLQKLGYDTGTDLYKILESSDIAEKMLMLTQPGISSVTIVSGLAGVFSGFAKHVSRISKQYNVDPRDVFFELGKLNAVAGQEDLIIEVAIRLVDKKINIVKG